MGRKKKHLDLIEDAKLSVADALPPPPAPPAPKPEPEPTPPAQSALPKLRRYRICVTRVVAMGGMLTLVNAGDVIDTKSYGEANIASLIAQGIPLEELAG